MELRYMKNARYLLVALLGTIFGCIALLIAMYNPLEMLIDAYSNLTPGSYAFKLWRQPPHDIYIKLYIFTPTNHEAFLRGEEKLHLAEKGPYVYKETITNIHTHFNDNGTLTFMPSRTLEVVVEKSIRDPRTEQVLMPNLALLGLVSALQDYPMLVNLAVSSFTKFYDSQPFLNLTVDEYLWGYDDPLVALANRFLPKWINFKRIGIADRLMAMDNGSSIVTINVKPNVLSDNVLLTDEEKSLPYSIQNWNGSPGLSIWGYREDINNGSYPGNTKCNLVEGAFEGSLFPRPVKENSSFRLYRRAFCRTVTIKHEYSGYTEDGFRAFYFRIDPNFLAPGDVYPENACYCTNNKCLPYGLGDLTPCYYDMPLSISQPHFYNADPSLLTQIDGLSPNKSSHDSLVTIHPEMGIPLNAAVRIQINMMIPDTKFNAKTRPFNNLTLPLFWADLGVDSMPTEVYIYLKLLFHILPVVQKIIMYLLGLAGMAMVFGSALAVVILWFNNDENDSLGQRIRYTPVQLVPMKRSFYKPDIRLCK